MFPLSHSFHLSSYFFGPSISFAFAQPLFSIIRPLQRLHKKKYNFFLSIWINLIIFRLVSDDFGAMQKKNFHIQTVFNQL